MTRKELISSREYWIATIQLDLYNEMRVFMEENNLNRTQLAERLGVTKGYVSQILNGDFDHKISKLVDLALLAGKVPIINYKTISDFLDDEKALTKPQKKNIQMRSIVYCFQGAETEIDLMQLAPHLQGKSEELIYG